MKKKHSEWFKNNIEEVNKVLGIRLKAENSDDLSDCAYVLDVYDSKDEYEENCDCKFEESNGFVINGKYVFFADGNYLEVEERNKQN